MATSTLDKCYFNGKVVQKYKKNQGLRNSESFLVDV